MPFQQLEKIFRTWSQYWKVCCKMRDNSDSTGTSQYLHYLAPLWLSHVTKAKHALQRVSLLTIWKDTQNVITVFKVLLESDVLCIQVWQANLTACINLAEHMLYFHGGDYSNYSHLG
jgi:hypothetical protein